MKKLCLVVLLLFVCATVGFAMAAPQDVACYKTDSCMNTWQCYGESIDECRKQAEDQGLTVADAGYWEAVGACQAGYCS